jgi:hypothetical protein
MVGDTNLFLSEGGKHAEVSINVSLTYFQGCGSGLDPDSIGSVDPDPDSESGSGIRIRIQEGKNDPQK